MQMAKYFVILMTSRPILRRAWRFCGAGPRSIRIASVSPVEDGYKALPSFTGFHGFDPRPVLESLNVPGLWLLAGEDRSIPTPATVAILDQLIASGKPYTHVVFPGAGHNLPPSWPDIEKWLAKTVQ